MTSEQILALMALIASLYMQNTQQTQVIAQLQAQIEGQAAQAKAPEATTVRRTS